MFRSIKIGVKMVKQPFWIMPFLLIAACSRPAKIDFSQMELTDALAKSKATGQMVLVDFYSPT
jgi:hypothetical protein